MPQLGYVLKRRPAFAPIREEVAEWEASQNLIQGGFWAPACHVGCHNEPGDMFVSACLHFCPEVRLSPANVSDQHGFENICEGLGIILCCKSWEATSPRRLAGAPQAIQLECRSGPGTKTAKPTTCSPELGRDRLPKRASGLAFRRDPLSNAGSLFLCGSCYSIRL